MDKQLREILDIFHKHQINYWLDNGTLLGLIREGQLLESDKDLDITVWEEETEKLRAILPVFRQLGYQIYSASYDGQIFKYNLTPADVKNVRTVDINIYRKTATHAWCPMYYFRLSPTREKTQKKQGVQGLVRSCLRSAWKQINAKVTLNVKIDRLPWEPFLITGTWWIPLEFYEEFTYRDDWQAYLPAKTEEYLAFRYGRWQVPQKDWFFYRDDRGVNPAAPKDLLKV